MTGMVVVGQSPRLRGVALSSVAVRHLGVGICISSPVPENRHQNESRGRDPSSPLPQAQTLDRLPTHSMHHSGQVQTFDT